MTILCLSRHTLLRVRVTVFETLVLNRNLSWKDGFSDCDDEFDCEGGDDEESDCGGGGGGGDEGDDGASGVPAVQCPLRGGKLAHSVMVALF